MHPALFRWERERELTPALFRWERELTMALSVLERGKLEEKRDSSGK